MGTYITQVTLKGFKSFNRKTELKLSAGLNCIIGPNGSGKSNIGDAICFILGRLSSKELRAENYLDLVFKRKSASAGEAEVTFVLDNSARIFPVKEKFVEIRRKIKKNGQTQYKINGKNVTRGQVLELLAAARIFPEGHNLVLQGDISRFVELKSIERRQIIEEVAGIGAYEERKAKALKELEKVEEKLKEAQIILAEKEAYLKELEKEKEEAQRYNETKELLMRARAAEMKLRIEAIERKKEKTDRALKETEDKIIKIKEQITQLEDKLAKLRQEIFGIESTLEKRGGEAALALQKEIEQLKVNIQRSRTLIEASEKEIERSKKRTGDLKKNLKDLEYKIKEKVDRTKELERALAQLSKKVSSEQNIEQKLIQREEELSKLNLTKGQLLEQIAELNSRVGELIGRTEALRSTKAEDIKLDELKKRYRRLIEQINKLGSRDGQLANELGMLRKELFAKESYLSKLRMQFESSQELLMCDLAVKKILSSKISGVLGLVADLGQVDEQFALALKIAAGARLKNIVVENEDVAISCLKLLKESKVGVATFLPLSKIRLPAVKSPPKVDGLFGLASDLISTEPKFKNLFRYIFANTLVVRDVEVARKLGIGKWRMVTLDGDLFELSGAITGGYRSKRVAGGFRQDSSALDKLEKEIAQIKSRISELERQREQLDIKIVELRKEKAALEGQIELASVKEYELAQLKSELKQLDAEKSALEKELKQKKSELSKLDNKIVEHKEKIAQLKEQLKSALAEGDLEQLNSTKNELALLKSELKNVLLPEKENILRLLRTLDKETSEFEQQIAHESAKIKELEKNLAQKEKEEQNAFKALRDLYAKKGKLVEEQRILESKLLEAKAELNKYQQEKNRFALDRAQIEGELAGLHEEAKELVGLKPIEYKSLEAARRAIKEFQSKLEEFGAVNLKALEIFNAVKSEYEQLAWKMSKLNTEKEDILEIITEIEKKKRDAFLATFNRIAENFERIFSKIAYKHKASLMLENKESPFDGGVAVAIKDNKGKRISTAALSGGEKVLVALAFIFAIQEYQPAPFYLLDEIDAALDKVNSEKVTALLKEYSKKAQIIIISHNDAVISEADVLFGVSMNKEGESSIVSLKI